MGSKGQAGVGLGATFADMAATYEALKAPTYAVLARHVAHQINEPGPLADLLSPYAEAQADDMIPLRLFAAVHRLVLDRRAPLLGVHFASVGGTPPQDSRAEQLCRDGFDDAVTRHAEWIAQQLIRVPQTNEVGRTVGLAAALRWVTGVFGLPVRLHEIGCSAGLSLRVDELARSGVIADERVDLGDVPEIVERVGVDRHPVDVTTPEGRAYLTSFVWPDHADRFERLRAALNTASTVPAEVLARDAVEHVRGLQLCEGTALVVWHSAMWMYLSQQQRSDVMAALEDVGRSARAEMPLIHVALEPAPNGDRDVFRLQVATWPGVGGLPAGQEILWAVAPPVGTPVQWAVPCAGAIARDREGRILLVERGQEPAKGCWSVPGGRLEPGESWVAGALRELTEETGLVGTQPAFVGVVERDGPAGATYVIADFAMAADGVPIAADDAANARWVDRDALATLPLTEGLIEALADWDLLPASS